MNLKNKMVLEEFDKNKLREDLLELYIAFLDNPEDKSVHLKAINYDRTYGSLEGYTSVEDSIKKAISFLSFMAQYGHHKEDSDLSKENLLKKAKIYFKNLKNS
jgi:hypothetical protein